MAEQVGIFIGVRIRPFVPRELNNKESRVAKVREDGMCLLQVDGKFNEYPFNVTMDSSINGKYVKFAHTGPHGLEDNTKWKSTNGQTCESIYTSKNKKSHCKQANKHGVTGNDACQCSC